jgi:hypothetical protein
MIVKVPLRDGDTIEVIVMKLSDETMGGDPSPRIERSEPAFLEVHEALAAVLAGRFER